MNIIKPDGMSDKEASYYIEEAKKRNPDKEFTDVELTYATDENNDSFVDVNFKYNAVPFERIRRITGYLVGTLDRFNNAKRAEVEDRVKHNITTDNNPDLLDDIS